jgi:propionate CoA-transferase
MAQVITAAEAVARIPDGATLGVSGLGLCGWAEEVGTAIETSFLDGGHPRDLTLVHGAGIGNALGAGTHHLALIVANQGAPMSAEVVIESLEYRLVA